MTGIGVVQPLPKPDEDSGLFASGHWVRDEPPVDVLPLRRAWIVAWTAISLALVPVAIWAMVALGNKDDAALDGASSRSDAVSPAPRTAAAPPAAPALAASDPAKTTPRPEESARPAVKQRVSPGSKERRMEVRRRAPPKGRPTDDWVPRGP